MTKVITLVAVIVILGGGYWYYTSRVSPGRDVSTTANLPELQVDAQPIQVSPSSAQEASQSEEESFVRIGYSDTYVLGVPSEWRTEQEMSTMGSVQAKVVYVYDENDRLVFRTRSPVAEVGYEDSVSTVRTPIQSKIGNIQSVLRLWSENQESGIAHYSWDGGDDFWGNSFEIMVFFGPNVFYKTGEDAQAKKNGIQLRHSSRTEFEKERVMIETILVGIQS